MLHLCALTSEMTFLTLSCRVLLRNPTSDFRSATCSHRSLRSIKEGHVAQETSRQDASCQMLFVDRTNTSVGNVADQKSPVRLGSNTGHEKAKTNSCSLFSLTTAGCNSHCSAESAPLPQVDFIDFTFPRSINFKV